jgi:hypothetical protein
VFRRLFALCILVAALAVPTRAAGGPAGAGARTSPNVTVLGNIPGSYAGIVFSGHYAFATGWATGLSVFDIANPAAPMPVGALPLPHFENEDVDLCGTTLLIANDRAEEDIGGVLHVVDISAPATPRLVSSLPLGLTGSGRGPGHIANFVTADCTQAWIDGGDDVEVVDLTVPAAPRSLGSFKSLASTGPDPAQPAAFEVTHDTEPDGKGMLWSVGGGGIAGYRLTADPLAPELVTSSGPEGTNIDFDEATSPYNDFIMHNSQRSGNTLLVTEEDYIDTDEDPPGGCNGQGKFETWTTPRGVGSMRPLDTWRTELNSSDSKAPLTVNCSSHWFDTRRSVAAVGWYEQGVRFLDTRNPRDIRQIGYYLPLNGSTWAAYWSPTASDIVYTADVYRGIDILRIDRGGPPEGPTVVAPIPDEWFGAPGTTSAVAGFQPSPTFGYFCAIPTD